MSYQDYFLAWFDDLAQNLTVWTSESLEHSTFRSTTEWVERLQDERRNAEREAKFMILNSTSAEEGATLTHNYHNALVNLIGRLHVMISKDSISGSPRMELCLPVQRALEEMLVNCERQFAHLVTEWYGVPITQLIPFETEVDVALRVLAELLEKDVREERPIHIVRNFLKSFVQRIHAQQPVSRKELHYYRGILDDIKNLHDYSRLADDCPILHEMLLYWNLNSRPVIAYFISCHDMVMGGTVNVEDRIEIFRQKLKLLDQIPQKSNYAYLEHMPSLKEFFKEYLIQEIRYLRTTSNEVIVSAPKAEIAEPKRRVRVHLSLDQVSIALKSLLELGVLDAPSLRYAFRSIISGLSTPNSETPSWDSARKRVYEAESRDIDAVVELFEKLAEHLRSSR